MLNLTSCVRADISPYQVQELARRIEQGDVSIHDEAISGAQDRVYLIRKPANALEREVIVAALKAFA